MLRKLLNLISIIPPTLRVLIVPLPKGAAHVDQFYAKRIQRMMSSNGTEQGLVVLFITHEGHR